MLFRFGQLARTIGAFLCRALNAKIIALKARGWKPKAVVSINMAGSQEEFDEAMFEFSTGQTDGAIARLKAILAEAPDYFDAQLALGGAYYAKGDYAAAIAEGRRAEKMRPQDQMVHTNLSRAYMKAGDKTTAEHHALQARIASWRGNMAAPSAQPPTESSLEMAKPPASKPPAPAAPVKFPDMPWKKK